MMGSRGTQRESRKGGSASEKRLPVCPRKEASKVQKKRALRSKWRTNHGNKGAANRQKQGKMFDKEEKKIAATRKKGFAGTRVIVERPQIKDRHGG